MNFHIQLVLSELCSVLGIGVSALKSGSGVGNLHLLSKQANKHCNKCLAESKFKMLQEHAAWL